MFSYKNIESDFKRKIYAQTTVFRHCHRVIEVKLDESDDTTARMFAQRTKWRIRSIVLFVKINILLRSLNFLNFQRQNYGYT